MPNQAIQKGWRFATPIRQGQLGDLRTARRAACGVAFSFRAK